MAFLIEDSILIGYPDEDEAASLVIPDIVTEIGSSVFGSCIELEEIKLPAKLKKIGDSAFLYCENLKRIVIPEGVTEIGEGAFKGCITLEEISLPSTIEIIGDWCFSECESLKVIRLPKNLTKIGYRVFDDCKALQKIDVDDENTVFCSIDGVLYNKSATELLRCPEGREDALIVPDCVEIIGNNSFWNCSVNSVQLSNHLKKVGLCAFWRCRLDEIELPDGVTEICDNAFCGCDELQKVTLPSSVSKIGSDCFDMCGEFELFAPEGSVAYRYFTE